MALGQVLAAVQQFTAVNRDMCFSGVFADMQEEAQQAARDAKQAAARAAALAASYAGPSAAELKVGASPLHPPWDACTYKAHLRRSMLGSGLSS